MVYTIPYAYTLGSCGIYTIAYAYTLGSYGIYYTICLYFRVMWYILYHMPILSYGTVWCTVWWYGMVHAMACYGFVMTSQAAPSVVKLGKFLSSAPRRM